jgi:hypothetical protein
MEKKTQVFIRIVRNTALFCAVGAVLGMFILELILGNGEGVFFTLVISPILALLGGFIGMFVGGWIAAFWEVWAQRRGVDEED